MRLKTVECVANSIDPDQMLYSAASEISSAPLYCNVEITSAPLYCNVYHFLLKDDKQRQAK